MTHFSIVIIRLVFILLLAGFKIKSNLKRVTTKHFVKNVLWL